MLIRNVPKIIICCWPSRSRREIYDTSPIDLFGQDDRLKFETDESDQENFLRNVFFVEKFANYTLAKVFHCFAEEIYPFPTELTAMDDDTLRSCWPPWDIIKSHKTNREIVTEPNLAQDGVHYGDKHHKLFAELVLRKFGSNLK